MWEQIHANKVRSVLVVTLLAVMLVACGAAAGAVLGGANAALVGAAIAFALWLIMWMTTISSGDQVLLNFAGARELPAGAADDKTFLKSVHDLVLDVRVVAAASACTHQKKLMLDVRVVARRFTSRRASLYVLTASVSTRSPTASPTCCCMRTKSSRLQPTCRREQRQT